jgi:hypothetical protein
MLGCHSNLQYYLQYIYSSFLVFNHLL